MQTQIVVDDIRKVMCKLCNGKAPGMDGLKNEMYKELLKSSISMDALCAGNLRILEGEGAPTSWKCSKTVMIPKKSKPTAIDLRPIAITEASYKILMSVVAEKMEEHVEVSGMSHIVEHGSYRQNSGGKN